MPLFAISKKAILLENVDTGCMFEKSLKPKVKVKLLLTPKSLYRCRAERHFYGTENVIWAGFGPIGNTEKKSLGRL